MYPLKKISFLGRDVSILCQNENGPCPLLAISNVLLLERRLEIDPNTPLISLEDLIQLVANRLIESNPPLEDEGMRANQQQQIDSVIQILPRLQYGLDVNIKFNGVDAFEYTQELDAFNMLDVSLYHGWLVDEEDHAVAQVIGEQSYNQLVEKAIASRAAASPISNKKLPGEEVQGQQINVSDHNNEGTSVATRENEQDPEVIVDITVLPDFDQPAGEVAAERTNEEMPAPSHPQHAQSQPDEQPMVPSAEGRIIQQFFADTASQLTFHGLSKLHERMRERQLAVFFRNNHFSTIFKYDGNLYLLVTDCGYQDVPQVVWEKLDMINGDTEYYNSQFMNSTPQNPTSEGLPIDSDYLVALQIQRQELQEVATNAPEGHNHAHQRPPSPDYAAMVAMGEQTRGYDQQQQQQLGQDAVLLNPETGQPYSEQELAWMQEQQRRFQQNAQQQHAGRSRGRRKSDSGDCIIL